MIGGLSGQRMLIGLIIGIIVLFISMPLVIKIISSKFKKVGGKK